MKNLRKIISGLVMIVIAISTISGCTARPAETTLTDEELVSTQTETETSEAIETPEEETIEKITEEITEATEETTEEKIISEKYFTYKAKYVEEYAKAILITDESLPGTLRVALSDDLPESFFEKAGCKSSEDCLNQVIKEILLSLKGKEIILRDTQTETPKLSSIDTTKPVEIVFKLQTKEERGPLYLTFVWEKDGVLERVFPASFAVVKKQDKGLRFIWYESLDSLEVFFLNLPRGRYLISIGLYWMILSLKFYPKILGWNEIEIPEVGKGTPVSKEEEKNLCRKFMEWPEDMEDPDLPPLSILFLKGDMKGEGDN